MNSNVTEESVFIRLPSDQEYTLEEIQAFETEFLEQYPTPYHEDLRKWFFYEFSPIVRIGENLNDSSIKIRFPKKNAPWDGEIITQTATTKIECVRAVDGYNEGRMLELLKEKHEAPAYQKIEASGTKNKRQFGNNDVECVEKTSLLKRFEEEVSQAYQHKNKQKKYKTYWLIIVADDWFIPSYIDATELEETCNKFWRQKTTSSIFEHVYVVGLCRNYKLVWKAPI